MKKNQTSERLKQFIKEQGLTIQEFEQICNLSNGYVNNIRKGVGEDKLEQILEHFPSLNKEWLLYGIGDEDVPVRSAPPSERSDVDRFLSIIEADHQLIREMVSKKDEEIDRLLAIMEADRGITYKKVASM